MPPEMRAQLDVEKVTNHVVLFLIPDMTDHYEAFKAELTTRGYPFHEITGQLRHKIKVPILKMVIAVVVPKLMVHGSTIHEIALKIGMVKK